MKKYKKVMKSNLGFSWCSQCIHFKQVKVQPEGISTKQPPGPSTHGKGKNAINKKPILVDNGEILDQITSNIKPGDIPP